MRINVNIVDTVKPVLYCVFASVGVKRKRKKHHERLLQDVKMNSNN